MTASEATVVGLAKQVAKGTPNVTDNAFSYFLFNQGNAAPQNVIIPLDDEVGGGAMPRGMVKVGVTSAGQFVFVPRPDTIGHFLLGAVGSVAAPAAHGGSTVAYDHVFTLPANQFSAPYYTVRSAPASLWGEQLQDMRVASLALSWKAADYLRGMVGLIGGLPTPVATTTWAALDVVDKGPQFLSPTTTIRSPTGTVFDGIKVLSGSIAFGLNIPLEEQWITGSYSPDDFEINKRQIAIQLAVKIAASNEGLYKRMMYDADSGAAWSAKILREADIEIEFKSDQDADTGIPYALKIAPNGQSGNDANVQWSCTPINIQAGRQITAVMSGIITSSPTDDEPITVTLTNDRSATY